MGGSVEGGREGGRGEEKRAEGREIGEKKEMRGSREGRERNTV